MIDYNAVTVKAIKALERVADSARYRLVDRRHNATNDETADKIARDAAYLAKIQNCADIQVNM